MWLLRSLAAALLVAVVAGCRDSTTYSAQEVADALRSHGLSVGVSDPDPRLTAVFAGDPQGAVPKGLEKTVGHVDLIAGRRPSGLLGAGDVILEAMIFDRPDQASCDEPNVIGTCLRKRNVVVVVRDRYARAAREALEDLD